MVDWGAYKRNVASKYDDTYWAYKENQLLTNRDAYSFDLKDKSITSGAPMLPDLNTMWSQYSKGAQSRGVTGNWRNFLEKYSDIQNVENKLFVNNLISAQMAGMKMKDIKKSLKADPASQRRLMSIYKASSADTELQSQILSFMDIKKPGIFETLTASPLIAPAVGTAAYYGSKAFGPKLADLKPGYGTAGLTAFSGDILQQALEGLGIDEREADIAGALGQVGIAGTLARGAMPKRLYGKGGTYQTPWKAIESVDDLMQMDLPEDIKSEINEYRKKHNKKFPKDKKTILKAKQPKMSQKILDDYLKMNPDAKPQDIAARLKTTKKLRIPGGKGKQLAMLLPLLTGAYDLLTED